MKQHFIQDSISTFFKTPDTIKDEKHPVDHPVVIGLRIIENFITREEERHLLEQINSNEWDDTLKRRTQHYGFSYNYTQKTISRDNYLGPLPDYTTFIIDRMINQKLITQRPVQLINNEYLPGQGIAAHTDARVFGDTVTSLSLGSHCGFTFTRELSQVEIFLKPRTLIIMSGDSRYKWNHSIPGRKSDINPTTKVNEKRGTRVSMTFRTVPGFT